MFKSTEIKHRCVYIASDIPTHGIHFYNNKTYKQQPKSKHN